MMRRLTLSLIALTAACSSATQTGGTSAPVIQSVGVAGTSDRMTIGGAASGPTTHTIDAVADRVWRVLPAAFDSIGVPVARVDPAQKVIGNEGYKVRQRLRSVPLSRYIDCGQTQIGPNADSYEVFMTLIVQVRAGTGGTTSSLVTTFETSARPLTFNQGYSRCSTRGSLEARLLEAVKAQLK